MKYEEFIQKAVLYCEQEYKDKMNETAKEFFRGLVDDKPVNEFAEQQQKWNEIDHDYMYQTEEELKGIVKKNDKVPKAIEERADIPNRYELDSVGKFKAYERAYGDRTISAYIDTQNTMEIMDRDIVLDKAVENYRKNVEQFIPYRDIEQNIVSMHTISTYLSMLYNVNLTRTGWNQTLKDAEILDKKLLILETHPYSCPECRDMQGRIYSVDGSGGFPSVDVAYEHGVGHPNCKCEWGIYWSDRQLKTQSSSTYGNYEKRQKLLALNRRIDDEVTKQDLYRIIGNYSMVDRQQKIINRLLELRKRTL